MLKKKDAQGLTIRVIILAIISLIIIVVLITLFSGRIGNFIGVLKEAQSCNEICQTKDYTGGIGADSNPDENNYEILIGARDNDGNQCYCKT